MRRKSERKNLRVQPENGRPVRINVVGENFLDTVYAMDISANGACIAVPHRYEGCRLDKRVGLEIHLPEPVMTTLETSGTIRHLSGNVFGVEFDVVEKDQAYVLRDYLTHLLAQQDQLKTLLFKWHLIR